MKLTSANQTRASGAITVSISDAKIAVEMYEVQRCAVMSGRRYSSVRIWKRKGDGLMTGLDKEHGYSYESRYEIFGVTTWCELEARNVPKWALPPAHVNFSIRDMPENMFSVPVD
jgi:hypothetical protein